MSLKIGVLALQGAFAKHGDVLRKLGAEPILVKKPEDLNNIDGLIIPGGESTTILRQIHFIDLFPPLRNFVKTKPIFGTCAGLILMSREILASPEVNPLQALDIAVERNAFGRQAESFGTQLEISLPTEHRFLFPAIFIRAPRIKQLGANVKILASFENEPVLIQEGIHLGSSFHPELTEDGRIHSYFLSQIENHKKK